LNGIERRYFKSKKPGKTGSLFQKRKVLINTTKHQSQTNFFVYYKILVVINSNTLLDCEK